MDESCSRQAQFWQVRVDKQPSPQPGELMMMFENLLSNIFSHEQQATNALSTEISKDDDDLDFGTIDHKIKDALQLMKTSLCFAIREEVDLLKIKVADLEMKIDELKSENRLLREYAPAEIIRQLEENAASTPSGRSPMIEQASSRIEA